MQISNNHTKKICVDVDDVDEKVKNSTLIMGVNELQKFLIAHL
jgi:hypothetical protein